MDRPPRTFPKSSRTAALGATCCLYRSPPPIGGRRRLDIIGSIMDLIIHQ